MSESTSANGLTVLNSFDAPAPLGPYSHATIVGGLLFCTGQLPLDHDGQLIAGGPIEQARRCLENLEAVCAAAGTTLGRAARVGIYVTDLSVFAELNEVYAEAVPHRPARTTIEVSALPMGAQVEIDAVVVLR
jgi:2-iminobutanoate/2-iminopropanoate deaminase